MDKIYVIKSAINCANSDTPRAEIEVFEDTNPISVLKKILEKEGVKYAFSLYQYLDVLIANDWQDKLEWVDGVIRGDKDGDFDKRFILFTGEGENWDWLWQNKIKFQTEKYTYRILD